MHKRLILAALFSLVALPAFAGATMPTIINGGTTPVTGTCPGGQFIYNNNGVAACETATAAMYATVDATQFSGADMCAKIAAAANTLVSLSPNSGTIDATGFSGTQTCAASPFGSWPGGGEFSTTIKFGRVTWVSNNQIVIPNRTQIVGTSPFSYLATSEGFVVQMGSSFTPNTGCPKALFVFGGTSCGSTNTSEFFNIQLRNADVRCDPGSVGISGSIGVLNTNAEEESLLQNVNTHGCYTGVQVGTSYAQNSGPYTNLGMSFVNTTGPGTQCLVVADPAASASYINATFRGISCGGGGSANSTNAINISGTGVRLVDSHVEEAVNGVVIGETTVATQVQVVNFSCTANMSGDCVQISDSHYADTIRLENIVAGSGSGITNTIHDEFSSYGGTIPASDEPRVASYEISGYSNSFGGGNYQHLLTDSFNVPSTIGHHLSFASVAPSIGSGSSDCGTSPNVVGNDTAGRITVGSGTNGGKCTLTFAKTWPNAPICTATDETTGVLVIPKGAATSSVAFTGSIVAGDTLAYHCFGYR
jgi:hypothetical protein